ncbi:hypothetical protein CF326_g5162 [Tilletia indica]|nr:hypothetical protein CF326_g5162 [Tilletia indica]
MDSTTQRTSRIPSQQRPHSAHQQHRTFSIQHSPSQSSRNSPSRHHLNDHHHHPREGNTIIVNVRTHERSYCDQEVIINPECFLNLPAFSYESDLVELTPMTEDEAEAATSSAATESATPSPADPPIPDPLSSSATADPEYSARRGRKRHPHSQQQQPNTRGPSRAHHSPQRSPSTRRMPKRFLFKPQLETSRPISAALISVHDSIATAFGLKAFSQKATLRKVSSHDHTLDHIELTFRDQYVGRAEMWRLAMSLEDRCLYVGQKINFAGIVRATVTRLWINESRVHCGYVAASTKPIFRSESAKINLFIQLAREMWEFDEDGELYFEKCLTGFMPALLSRWKNADTNHVISVILFARVFYDYKEVEMLRRRHEKDPHAVPIRTDVKGRYYADYFKVVLDLESQPDWGAVMETLKEEFFRFQHDILLLRRARQSGPHQSDPLGPEKSDILQQTPLYQSGYQDSSALQLLLREQVALAGSLSYSYEGCILEAINLTLNPFDEHFIDRDLTRTGLSLIFVTAGTGHFEVDKKMLRITTERMIECGIGLDLVCLTKMPLHSVPLFKFSSELLDFVNYLYPERWDQAGPFGREQQQQQRHSQHQHGHRTPIPTSFATSQPWMGPKQTSAQTLPDPLYFDASRPSAVNSPQITTSSAASTLGRASAATMTASDLSSLRASTNTQPSTINPDHAPSPSHPHPHQPPTTIEYYSMPHWIDCSFYNLQMDKPFRADRFVPRCKMFEVQMMGIMENELADISIPYLDERAAVVLRGSVPGTPSVGLPHLTRPGAGVGGGAGGGGAGIMVGTGTGMGIGTVGLTSPYGLGPGSGSYGMGGPGFSSALTVRPPSKLSSTLHTHPSSSSSTASYFDAAIGTNSGSGNVPEETDRRERAGRQMARDMFDDELFKAVEPAHLSALRNAHGQIGQFGVGGEVTVAAGGGGEYGANAQLLQQQDGTRLGGVRSAQQGPIQGAAGFQVSARPATSESPRTIPNSSRRPSNQKDGGRRSEGGVVGAEGGGGGTGGPSSISPEKNPTAAMILVDRARGVVKASHAASERDRSSSRQRGQGSQSSQQQQVTPGRSGSRPRPIASSRLQYDHAEQNSSVESGSGSGSASGPYRTLTLLNRSLSRPESVRSSSTAPTIVRESGRLPGTVGWTGRATLAQPALDSAALMLYHNGILDVDADGGGSSSVAGSISALPSPASTTRALPSVTAASASDLVHHHHPSFSRAHHHHQSPSRGGTQSLVHAATISGGSRVVSPAPPSTPERPQSMVSDALGTQLPPPKSMTEYLKRGLSWWGGQQAQAQAQAQAQGQQQAGGEAYRTLQRFSTGRPGSSVAGSSSASVSGAGAGGSGSGTGSISIIAKRPPVRGPVPFTSPEVPKVSNPRQIKFETRQQLAFAQSQARVQKAVNPQPATSPTSTPIAIEPQSPRSRGSPERFGGQSQREVWKQNEQEEELVKQRSLETYREMMQIAAQMRIEKQTLVNPSNPHKNRLTLSSQLGRWQHLFPTRTNRHTVKWLSMTSPACLPLTTLYLPLEADLAANWKESPYTITASTDALSILTKRSATTAPAVAIVREMASQRLAQGFQFIVPSFGWNDDNRYTEKMPNKVPGMRHAVLRHHPSDLFQVGILTSGSPVFLSLPNEIHQISCDQGLVKVKRYLRNTEYDTSPIEYSCYIWARNLPSYQTVHASFKYPDSASYDWNYLDSIISGAEEPRFTESLRYWRTRFVLVPSEEPPKEMLAPNGSPLSNEEIRLMGMDKLADLFMKARFRSPQAAPAERGGGGGGGGGRSRGWDLRFIPTSLDPAASVHDENFMRALERFVQERAKERERDAVPAKAKRLADLSLDEIVKEMWKEDGLKIHDRLWHRIWYSDAFTGAEFVTWLCRKFDDVRSREDAVEWGTKLQEQGLFQHAGKARGFIDGHAFYSVGAQWAGTQPKKWYNKVRPHRGSSDAAENNPSAPKRRRVQMSDTLYVDLASGRKSDRYETAILHHDIAHNPANGFNFQIHWLGTTARFVEDTIRNWTANVERYGLRLIEAPVGQIKDIAKHNPFQAPMRIKLAVAPPPTSSYAHLLPVHVLPEQYFEYALLRYFGFILDQEASDRYPDNIEIVYESRPPKFDYSQFVHRSGIAFVQVMGGEEGFLWLNNRLFTSHLPANSRAGQGQRAASRGGSDLHQQLTPTAQGVTAQAQADADTLRYELADFCADKELLQAFYDVVKRNLQERADFITKQQQSQPNAVLATPMAEESETAGFGWRRRKAGEILWSK